MRQKKICHSMYHVGYKRPIKAQWCHMASEDLANIGWGNGLLLDSTKSLTEVIITYNQRCYMTYTCRQFGWKC